MASRAPSFLVSDMAGACRPASLWTPKCADCSTTGRVNIYICPNIYVYIIYRSVMSRTCMLCVCGLLSIKWNSLSWSVVQLPTTNKQTNKTIIIILISIVHLYTFATKRVCALSSGFLVVVRLCCVSLSFSLFCCKLHF